MLIVVLELPLVLVLVRVGVFPLAVSATINVLPFIGLAVGVGGQALPSVVLGGVACCSAVWGELVWLLLALFVLLLGHRFQYSKIDKFEGTKCCYDREGRPRREFNILKNRA